MLYATIDNKIIGFAFGRVDINDTITIGPVGVDSNYRNMGIAKEMVLEIEKNAITHNIYSIILGAVESAEGFYAKLDYKGSLLIQSQIHSMEELLSLNNKYNIEFTNIYDGKVNQLCLELEKPDRELQKEYEIKLNGSYTQMIFSKTLDK